jgi:hypothetical protein
MTNSEPPTAPEVLVNVTVLDPKTAGSGVEPFTLRCGSLTALVNVTVPEASEFTVTPVATPATVIEKVALGAHPVSCTTLLLPTAVATVATQLPVLPPGLVLPPGTVVTVVVPGYPPAAPTGVGIAIPKPPTMANAPPIAVILRIITYDSL